MGGSSVRGSKIMVTKGAHSFKGREDLYLVSSITSYKCGLPERFDYVVYMFS